MISPQLSLGAIVSFKSPKEVKFSSLKVALAAAGLDENLARELLPKNAFKRATRTLAKNRVIDVVSEDEDNITFQFTRKELQGDRMDFVREHDVVVNKKTGTLYAHNLEFEKQAQILLDKELETRYGGDVTKLVHKIFDVHGGDLIKIRPQGGAYFVPQKHSYLVENIRTMMEVIGGELLSYEIGGESETTKQSIAQNMHDHFQQLIREFQDSCEMLTGESSEEAKQARVDRFKALKVKADAYKDLMRGFADEIHEAFGSAEVRMNVKLFEVFDEDLQDEEPEQEEDGGEEEPPAAPGVFNIGGLLAGIML